MNITNDMSEYDDLCNFSYDRIFGHRVGFVTQPGRVGSGHTCDGRQKVSVAVSGGERRFSIPFERDTLPYRILLSVALAISNALFLPPFRSLGFDFALLF
ncbi:hypothetical protein SDJN02_24606, partial [Cucurbita argyrosperma subsp. argyrosperma]